MWRYRAMARVGAMRCPRSTRPWRWQIHALKCGSPREIIHPMTPWEALTHCTWRMAFVYTAVLPEPKPTGSSATGPTMSRRLSRPEAKVLWLLLEQWGVAEFSTDSGSPARFDTTC